MQTALSGTGEVRREMMQAAGLSADDARLILARRTAEMLEGGRMARLAPDRRRVLESLATRLGVRAFDANLVIAIAQDAARNGEPVASPEVGGRLGLVHEATMTSPGTDWVWTLGTSAALAAIVVAMLVRWIGG